MDFVLLRKLPVHRDLVTVIVHFNWVLYTNRGTCAEPPQNWKVILQL